MTSKDRRKQLTNTQKKEHNKDGIPIRCQCGKVIAYEINGVIYVYCKGCKRQIAVVRAKSL